MSSELGEGRQFEVCDARVLGAGGSGLLNISAVAARLHCLLLRLLFSFWAVAARWADEIVVAVAVEGKHAAARCLGYELDDEGTGGGSGIHPSIRAMPFDAAAAAGSSTAVEEDQSPAKAGDDTITHAAEFKRQRTVAAVPSSLQQRPVTASYGRGLDVDANRQLPPSAYLVALRSGCDYLHAVRMHTRCSQPESLASLLMQLAVLSVASVLAWLDLLWLKSRQALGVILHASSQLLFG